MSSELSSAVYVGTRHKGVLNYGQTGDARWGTDIWAFFPHGEPEHGYTVSRNDMFFPDDRAQLNPRYL